MSLWTLLLVYVLGGLTFLPLAAVAFVAGLIYLSPPVGDTDVAKRQKEALFAESAQAEITEKEKQSTASTKPLQASWLVVRRTFEEPPDNNASYVGNLMRSLYDNSKQSISSSSSSNPRRPKDTFYAMLKGTVLYLYEDEAGSDCYAALQIAAYDVEVFSENKQMTDGELFAKRNAIRLRAKDTAKGGKEKGKEKERKSGEDGLATVTDRDASPHRVSDEHFIFVKSATLMEDWYFALLNATASAGTDAAPSVEPVFSALDMAHLVKTLDQQPDPIPMRWLNALIGRIFFSLYRTSALEANLVARIMKKLSKVPRPAFLTDITVKEVNVGNSAPFFSKPMLKELTKEGDASVEMGLCYKSQEGMDCGVRITVEATVTIDLKDSLPLNLGTRFDVKPRVVKLILAIVLRSLEGNIVLRAKTPPSNRLWWGFTTMPKMELELLPIVSDRKIKWGLVLKPIENLLREVIQESIVLPYMDDIPFFDTAKKERRGGIFADAVRATYDFSAPSTATLTTVNGITTVSPSTTIPTSANISSTTDGSTQMFDDGSPMPPGGFGVAGDQSPAQTLPQSQPDSSFPSDPPSDSTASGTSLSRTGTVQSTASSSSAQKRRSWLPRFAGRQSTVNEGEPQLKPSASINAQGPVIEDSIAEGTSSPPTVDVTDTDGPEEASGEESGKPEANQVGSDKVMDTRVVDEAEASEILAGHGTDGAPKTPKSTENQLRTPDRSPIITPSQTLEAEWERTKSTNSPRQQTLSTKSSIPQLTGSPRTLNRREGTLTHHPSQSAAANFYVPQKPSTSSDESIRPDVPSSDSALNDTTLTSAGLTATGRSTPMSSGYISDSARSTSSLSRSTEGTSSNTPPQSAAQTLLTAWKSRATTDKQVLANTARDVARDAMKKWGFGAKKDNTSEATPAQTHARRPSTPGSDAPRASTPEIKAKTYSQLKAEFAQRHEVEAQRRRGVSTSLGQDEGDVFSSNSPESSRPSAGTDYQQNGTKIPGLTGLLNVTPARPASAQVHIGSPVSTPKEVQPTPPALPPRELQPDAEARLRKTSGPSQPTASPKMPVQRQPGQGMSMQIPGIHASHRGEVMAMGSTPSPPKPSPISLPPPDGVNGDAGTSKPPALQSVYRLFNRTGALNSNSGVNTVESTAAPPAPNPEGDEVTIPKMVAPPRPPPLPARRPTVQKASDDDQPLVTSPPIDNAPPASSLQRASSSSSASSALKQIQARSDAAQPNSRDNSPRNSLALSSSSRRESSSVLTPSADNGTPTLN
ncbi:hypothetical protein FRB94_000776 [Tulasnella sp. JGI-2019a]|nr:hypothetical protein FRB93_002673 [Tulasnella sp. JGI-2019a]KAG9013796.1 hypothetical protein FRB94_000776 [Tulasnella sp. JGI-2019a]